VLVTHVVMSAYWWSGYPYDNVCENGAGEYSYCAQNFWSEGIFPPLPRFQPEGTTWMTESQELLTSLYAWSSVVVVFIASAAFIQNAIIPKIRAIYKSTYEVSKNKLILALLVVEFSSKMLCLPCCHVA